MGRRRRLRQWMLAIIVGTALTQFHFHFVYDVVAVVSSEHASCSCVECDEDPLCGGLWKGTEDCHTNSDPRNVIVHMIVSHCKTDLGWISDFTKGYNISSVLVATKCGIPVTNAPPNATIVVLPNVGRCDHSYVNYINDHLGTILGHTPSSAWERSIVMFFKDNLRLHQPGTRNKYVDMIRVASSCNGFACGITPGKSPSMRTVDLSAFHESRELAKFTKGGYNNGRYPKQDSVKFASSFEDLGSFYNALNATPLPEMVQVCYGGIFAAAVENIIRVNSSVWEAAEMALSRGDNLAESHFMERLWGSFLGRSLQPYQIDGLRNYSSTDSLPVPGYLRGVLCRKDN